MDNKILHIKNMVCERCIMSVENILENQELPYTEVSMGQVVLNRELSPGELQGLEKKLQEMGFELVQERQEKIVNQIKSVIIEAVYRAKEPEKHKLSKILSAKLHYDYSYLTGLFSKAEGKSIQSFQNKVKIERIKELLEYGELNMNEIADAMGFGSAAYLSTFFKKETGTSPSHYKNVISERKSLDEL